MSGFSKGELKKGNGDPYANSNSGGLMNQGNRYKYRETDIGQERQTNQHWTRKITELIYTGLTNGRQGINETCDTGEGNHRRNQGARLE